MLSEKEQQVFEFLKDWKMHLNDIRKQEERLLENYYKISPNYSNEGGGTGNGSTYNKLENYCIKRVSSMQELDKKKNQIYAYETAINHAQLTAVEFDTIELTKKGQSLLCLIHKYEIPQAKVYRIRLNAIKKIAKHI